MKLRRWLLVGLTVMAILSGAMLAEDEDKDKGEHEKEAAKLLRLISNAERAYAMNHTAEGFACSLQTLGQAHSDTISKELASGKGAGYNFRVICGGDSEPYQRVILEAAPADQKDGGRAFCADLYFVMGKVTGGIFNGSKDGRGDTCMLKGAPIK